MYEALLFITTQTGLKNRKHYIQTNHKDWNQKTKLANETNDNQNLPKKKEKKRKKDPNIKNK